MAGSDPLFFNKVAGAVLGALLFAMALNVLAEGIFSGPKSIVAGYALPGESEEPAAAAAPAGAASEPLPVLLAKADAKKGEAGVKPCQACHNFEKGGPNKIGPNLYGVVNRVIGSHEGFNYSAILKEHAGKGDKWTFETLDHFINNPKGTMPGTAMGYAGMKEADKRADVLAYLRTLSDSPADLPK
jgi:cytochrome c